MTLHRKKISSDSTQCNDSGDALSRYFLDVATLKMACRYIGGDVATLENYLELMLRHCFQCHDIEKAFSSFRILLAFFFFLSAYSSHACEYNFNKN